MAKEINADPIALANGELKSTLDRAAQLCYNKHAAKRRAETMKYDIYDIYNMGRELVYPAVSVNAAEYHSKLSRQEILWAIEEFGACSSDELFIVEQGSKLPDVEEDWGSDPMGDWWGRNE